GEKASSPNRVRGRVETDQRCPASQGGGTPRHVLRQAMGGARRRSTPLRSHPLRGHQPALNPVSPLRAGEVLEREDGLGARTDELPGPGGELAQLGSGRGLICGVDLHPVFLSSLPAACRPWCPPERSTEASASESAGTVKNVR